MPEESKIKEITHFKFTLTPMFSNMTQIRAVDVHIYAPNREEAYLIFERDFHKFSDLDIRRSIEEVRHGYTRTNQDTEPT